MLGIAGESRDTAKDKSMLNSPGFLRAVLYFDAVTCLLMGLLLILGAGPLSSILGLPAPLLRVAALILLPFAGLLYLTARRPASQAAVALIVAINAAWVVASVALLLSDWIQPTALGVAFVAIQAVAVAAIAAAEGLAPIETKSYEADH